MRIHELPGDPKLAKEEVAVEFPAGTKTTCLYNGVDLEGWKIAEGQKDEWTTDDHELKCTGKTKGNGLELRLPGQGGGEKDFTLQVDFNDDQGLPFSMGYMGAPSTPIPTTSPAIRKGWNRAVYTYHDRTLRLDINGEKVGETGFKVAGLPWPTLILQNPGHPVSFANIILIQEPEKK
jgi:hypothetical protein